ncbi:MAG: glycogen synthase [Myxococcales bacterium]|jgi:starch synthase|nr:glycogen synthase [Myxococcales bacterium]
MDILMPVTELAPYVKVGGLSDVAAALPKTLRGAGHKVTLVLPRFAAFESSGLSVARRLTPLPVKLGDATYDVVVYDGRLPSQVDVVLVDVPGLFDRAGVYGERGEDYPDNGHRFALFSKAVAELVRQRAEAGNAVDVVHCHDWPTALVPRFLRELGVSVPTVLTIHNLAYQGVFPKETLPSLGLSWDDFVVDGVEFYGGVNLLKMGVLTATALTTVSPTYAREIVTPERGEKLDGVLAARRDRTTGILNGVDYAVWNPATDSVLAARYDAEDRTNKARCKGALQKELGLGLDLHAPIVACVGRMVPQKGTDLVADAIGPLLRATDAQIVVAGDGDPALVRRIATEVERSRGRAVFVQAAAEAVVHRIFAGADVTLVPSRYEPCGLVQMYAQRYGALPVARATGGLVDSIVDCDAKLETGTGFLFEEPTAQALVSATLRAIAARNHERYPALVRRVMRLDRGWERAARLYEQVYRSVTRPS